MSNETETSPRGLGTARFALNVGDASIEVEAQLPEGLVAPVVLLPVLQKLSNSLSELTVRRADRMGEKLSCCAGCGACCRQAVPISPVEARAIAEWLDEQPQERQSVLRERFRQASAKLEDAGIAQEIREPGNGQGREAMHALGLRYFALGIACPFLEEERCTIHEIRPLRCREYLVVSPAEHCAHPETKEIVGIKPQVLLSQILARWDTNGDARPHELILLTLLDEWIAKHPADQDCARRTSPELLQEFLHAFAHDAAAAPADPRGLPDEAVDTGSATEPQ
jgi:Fe-S-cluster containining protein